MNCLSNSPPAVFRKLLTLCVSVHPGQLPDHRPDLSLAETPSEIFFPIVLMKGSDGLPESHWFEFFLFPTSLAIPDSSSIFKLVYVISNFFVLFSH